MNGLERIELRRFSEFLETWKIIHRSPRLSALVYSVAIGIFLTAVYVCRDEKRRSNVGFWLLFCVIIVPRYYYKVKHIGFKTD